MVKIVKWCAVGALLGIWVNIAITLANIDTTLTMIANSLIKIAEINP